MIDVTPPIGACNRSALCPLIGLLLALSLSALAQGQNATIRSGHGGHWYDPARDGEGWVLELLGDDVALLYWFTYDETGRQRWLTAVGRTEEGEHGDYLDFPTLVVTHGGRFGPDFDPDQVEREAVGSATLHFANCDQGEFHYEAFGQTQTFSIERLAHTMGTLCESRNGVPGRDSAVHAGLSGSWYDPTHDGEGYALQWMNPQQALITWYSYDPEGRQYWMLGVGELDDEGRLHFPQMHATRGARFGAGFDPNDVERFEWGELSLELECDEGEAEYVSVLTAFGTGHFDLQRLTRPRGLDCPWQRPKLTDLYEISYMPIPIDPGTLLEPNRIRARKITDDGTVWGTVVREEGHQIVRFQPTAITWDPLPGGGFDSLVYVPRDGALVVANQWVESTGDTPAFYTPVLWRDQTGWTSLFGMSRAVATGVSRNGTYVVGRGPHPDRPDEIPWIWDVELGRMVLATNVDAIGPYPTAVSDDGRVVAGIQIRFAGSFPRPKAVRWLDGNEPESLYDAFGSELGWSSSCNVDCSVIFGFDQSLIDTTHPHSRQAWYWKAQGESGYLGHAEDVFLQTGRPYWLGEVTRDGTLVTGSYVTSPHTAEAYLWTQSTGLVSLEPLLQELQLAEPWTERAAASVSSSGDLVLLSGELAQQPGQPLRTLAAVLRLEAKSSF